jgi:hypothetical protein
MAASFVAAAVVMLRVSEPSRHERSDEAHPT